MTDGKSRAKGVRGERDVKKRLGVSARRTGHSYIATPVDVENPFAVFQVRNKTIGGSEIAYELGKLEAVTDKNAYVVFKVKGKWYVAETLRQHIGDHGEFPKEKLEE